MRNQTNSPQNIFTDTPDSLAPLRAPVPATEDIGAWLEKADRWPKNVQVHAVARDKAWEVLQHPDIGLANFTALANCPAHQFKDSIPSALHQPVADALHVLGWHVYNNARRPSLDQALCCLRLAHTVTPQNMAIVRRGVEIAETISEEDLPRVRVENRGSRIIAFRLSAQRMVLDTLESLLGIAEGAIRNSTAPHVPQIFKRLSDERQSEALSLLESLSSLSLKLGLSEAHLNQLQLAEDAACTHLACVGYPRSPRVLVSDMFITLKKTSHQAQVDAIRRGLAPGVENILEHLAHIQDVKLDTIPRLIDRAVNSVERATLERKLAESYSIADGIHFIFGMLYPAKH